MRLRSDLYIRLTKWNPTRLFLFINLVTTTLIIFSAGAAALRRPIGTCSVAIVLGTLVVTLAFLLPFRRVIVSWVAVVGFAIGIVTTFYALWPAISQKAMISIFPDASNYVAFSQYLFRYPAGTEGGLSPIDQYASCFSESRFATPAVLGVIARFLGGDPGLALIPFAGLLLLNVFAGFATLARHYRCSVPTSIAAGVFGVLVGWVPDMLCLGSLDNLLFVALFPFLLVRMSLVFFGTKNIMSKLALAINSAAVFYTYPEGLAIAGAMFAPFFCGILARAWRQKSLFKKFGVAACAAVIIALPYFGSFFTFLILQWQRSSDLTLGNGMLPGLMAKWKFLPASFALGEEFAGVPFKWWDLLFPTSLVILLVCGMIRWRRREPLLVLTILLFAILALWQGLFRHFSYGLYKVLTIGSILVIAAAFAGIDEICSRYFRRIGNLGPGLIAGVVVVLGCIQVSQSSDSTPKRFHFPLEPYSDLRKIDFVTQNAPISVMCDNDIDQQWALIYLRDHPQELRFERVSYHYPKMGRVVARAKREAESAKYLLTNHKMPGAVWANSKFWLAPFLSDFVPIVVLTSENGVQEVGGVPFIWLSDGPSTFVIDSPQDGSAVLFSQNIWIGPSGTKNSSQKALIRDANGLREQNVVDTFFSLLSLKKGINSLDVWCADKATVKRDSAGLPGKLLLGLENYRVKIIKDKLQLVGVIQAPNRPESYLDAPFLWVGNEPSSFLVYSPKLANAVLTASQVVLGPSCPGLRTRTVVVKADGKKQTFEVNDSFSVPVSLKPGLTRIDVSCANVPTLHLLANGDTRTLLLGLVNYRVEEATK